MFTTHRRWLLHFGSTLLMLSIACASAPGAPSGAGGRSGSDVITQQELADPAVAGGSLLEAIRHLRPRYLNDRSTTIGGKSEGVQVSIDGSSLVPAAELAQLAVSDASEVRYLSVADANLRFGLKGALSPVLLITLRRH
jgi:hypothetical protein